MYVPKAFAVAEPAEVGSVAASMIDAVGVGHLVTHHPDGMQSSFVPVLFDHETGVVCAHLARANPQQRAIDDAGVAGAPALLIVTGASGYVSPSWYATKAATGKVVPTWNYEVVHLHGTAHVVDDAAAVERVVRDLTARHEVAMAQPWQVDDAPRDYLDAMLRAIVAVEVRIERVEAKRKLSQNRTADDVAGVIDGLRSRPPAPSLADAMVRLAAGGSDA
jgi:transcriptional regulator